MNTRDVTGKVLMALAVLVCLPGYEAAPAESVPMKLHETPWMVDGKPILGTYMGGREKMEDLRLIRDAGMNVVLGGEEELDPTTAAGAFCLENGIRVLYHLTSHIYHGVKLRGPVTAEETVIPLYFAHGRPAQESRLIQLDDELIRYETMTDDGLINCQRGYGGTQPAEHREGLIVFWPEPCAAEVERLKSSPNLFGYYVLDDSPGDAVSALRALYGVVQKTDTSGRRPVCAGFGDAGSVINLAPGVCDIMFIYWYPVSTTRYDRERTSQEAQRILTAARRRAPGIPFVGIYQAFDGREAKTGQGVPTPEQLREQLEDFVREGACGLVSYWSGGPGLPGWADLPGLATVIKAANEEIASTGALVVRPETESMKLNRLQPEGHWQSPQPLHGVPPAWYVLGPFDDTAGARLAAEFPPDREIDFGATYAVKFGAARWRIRETTCGIVGLTNLVGDQIATQNCVSYAFCTVASQEERTVQLRVCTDDDAWVRLNGAEVYRFEGARGLDYDKDIVTVTLPAGESRIEVKVCNRVGMWGFFLRFTGLDGKPLEGLVFSPEP